MKLSKFIEGLQALAKEHGDLEVVYSVDDEGNSYHPVHYLPSIGNYDDNDQMFTGESEEKWYKEFHEVDKMPINAVVIN